MKRRLALIAALVLALGIGVGIGSAGSGLSSLAARLAAPTATATPQPSATPTSISTSTAKATPTRTISQLLKTVGPSIVRIRTETGEGTGFVAIQGGQILTAFHVVGNTSERPTVVTTDGTEFQAVVYGADEEKDMALLLVPGISAPPLPLARGASAGDQVIAIGYAAGLPGEPSVTRGIVSGMRVVSETDVEYMQTDAPINPGNSGGPLLNEQGEVVGMNVLRLRGSRAQYENMGFAVSAQSVLSSLDQLRSGAVKLLPTSTPVPRVAVRPTAVPVPTATPYVVKEYTERRANRGVYFVQQWSDGRFTEPLFVILPPPIRGLLAPGEIGRITIQTTPGASCEVTIPGTTFVLGRPTAGASGVIEFSWRTPPEAIGWTGGYGIVVYCALGSANVLNTTGVYPS